MTRSTHVLKDGRRVVLQLKKSARKNIIMRPVSSTEICVNRPPFLSEAQLTVWLLQNEHYLLDLLSRPTPSLQTDMPPAVWFRGKRFLLTEHETDSVTLTDHGFLLPRGDWLRQRDSLINFLKIRAAETLLPRILEHAEETNLHPVSVNLSDAKTFWGVCRKRSGIRLNWRLIGAPDQVIDYVCIHELCHLRHADHSSDFWTLVNRLTPHTAEAKLWLKEYGRELFL